MYMYIEKEKIATDAIYATVLKYITDKKQSKGAQESITPYRKEQFAVRGCW